MNILFEANELLELTKLDGVEKLFSDTTADNSNDLQIKALKLNDISFSSGNIVDITTTVKTAANGNILLKIGSVINNLSGRKNVKFTLTAPTPAQLNIVLHRVGFQRLGPGNLILSLLSKAAIKIFSTFGSHEVAKGVILQDNAIIIKLDRLLESIGAEIKINSLELLDNSCYIDIDLTNNPQEKTLI